MEVIELEGEIKVLLKTSVNKQLLLNTVWCISPKSFHTISVFFNMLWVESSFFPMRQYFSHVFYYWPDEVEVNTSVLIHSTLLSQIIVTLLECSIIQSSPPGPSNLLLRTSDSCWLLPENSRTTWPKAVAFLHGKLWLSNVYHSNLSGGRSNKTTKLQQLISLALLIVSSRYLCSIWFFTILHQFL